jgi:hypothetical protein
MHNDEKVNYEELITELAGYTNSMPDGRTKMASPEQWDMLTAAKEFVRSWGGKESSGVGSGEFWYRRFLAVHDLVMAQS